MSKEVTETVLAGRKRMQQNNRDKVLAAIESGHCCAYELRRAVALSETAIKNATDYLLETGQIHVAGIDADRRITGPRPRVFALGPAPQSGAQSGVRERKQDDTPNVSGWLTAFFWPRRST